MPKPQRTDRSFKVAHWAEVQRIYHTVTLTAFCHAWALLVVSILIPSALTVLQFLAGLNRAGKNGYRGCAVAYSLLAPRVALATGRKCSVRTLERGLAALRRLGLIELHWWTMPDEHIRNGDHDHRIPGTRRVQTSAGWRMCQIRIVVLTERALALWDKRSASKGSDIIPHFAQFLTPAKMADSPQIDPVGLQPTKVQDNDKPKVSSTDDCQGRYTQGRSTRPGAGQASPPSRRPTLEHQASTPDLVTQRSKTESQTPPAGFEEALTSAQLLSDTQGALSPPRPGTGDPVDPPTLSKEMEPCPGSSPKGVSHNPPRLPKHAPNKTSWSVARAYLLVELHHALAPYSRRQADAIYERARFELSQNYPTGWKTIIDWAYWVGRFATFSRAQRRHHMIRDIIPLLKSRVCPTPSEPRRFGQGSDTHVQRMDKTLAPYLKSLFDRFCGD